MFLRDLHPHAVGFDLPIERVHVDAAFVHHRAQGARLHAVTVFDGVDGRTDFLGGHGHLQAARFLHLEALVDQGIDDLRNKAALDVGGVFDARGGHEQAHAVLHFAQGYDLVVDHRGDTDGRRGRTLRLRAQRAQTRLLLRARTLAVREDESAGAHENCKPGVHCRGYQGYKRNGRNIRGNYGENQSREAPQVACKFKKLQAFLCHGGD